jgi:hypothetical protein
VDDTGPGVVGADDLADIGVDVGANVGAVVGGGVGACIGVGVGVGVGAGAGDGTTSLLLNADHVSMATVRVTSLFSKGNFALEFRSLTVMCSDIFVLVTFLATLFRVI